MLPKPHRFHSPDMLTRQGLYKPDVMGLPNGWFYYYAQSDNHRRKKSQCDDFVHDTLKRCEIKYI